MLKIKLSFSSILLCFLFASTIQAQSYIGGQFGMTRSKTKLSLLQDNNDIFIQSSPLNTLNIAAGIELNCTDFTAILIEPNFSAEGILLEKRMTATSESFYTEHLIKYLRLPILFKLKLELKSYQIYGVGGVYTSYALRGTSASFRPNDSLLGTVENSSFDLINFEKEGLSRFDYGAILGLGLEKKLNDKIKMTAGLRYNIGLKDTFENDDKELYNQSFSILMGVYFPLIRGRN